MYRTFQQDMYRLKLMTARSYVKALTDSLNPMTEAASGTLKLAAQVHGLGPVFRLRLQLQNNNEDKAVVNLFMTFYCDDNIYQIENNYIPVPYLVPGLTYSFDAKVRCISALNVADTIRVSVRPLHPHSSYPLLVNLLQVFVARESESVPILSAMISMPASEAVS